MATLQLGSRQDEAAPETAETGFLARIRASKPIQAVLAVATLVVLLLIAGVSILTVELREREIEDTRRSLLNLNALLAEGTSRTLENVDLVVQSTLQELRDLDISSVAALSRLRSSRSLHDSLKGRVSGLPQLEAISIVDHTGRLVSYSRDFPIPDIDLSDREHFQRLREIRGDETSVSEPVENRATGTWTVYLAKRILDPDGRFLGVVYGGISLDYFQRSFARLTLGRGASVSLWRLDGQLLVRHPPIGKVGHRYDTPAFRNLGRDAAPVVYETTSSIIGKPTIVARHVVDGFPVLTVVARARVDVLAQVREQETVLLIAGALLAGAVIALTTALLRQFWAYEAVARAENERAAAVADLGELEDQLRQSQKLEVIGQLASGVAHDFNNLLTVVIGNLDRLSRRFGEGNPDLERYVAGARSGAERAAGLSQRLLAFSRRQPLAPMRLDLNDIVENLTDLLQQSLGKRAVLETNLGRELPSVHVDRGGLESALLNLVVNARDAMQEGGRVTISTHAVPDSDGGAGVVCIAVSDTGSGMTPEVVARAFEPFFTTKEPGVGTGLGLAQVAGFVRDNGGTASIDTSAGQGCRVTLCLPAHIRVEDRRQPDPAPDGAPAEPKGNA